MEPAWNGTQEVSGTRGFVILADIDGFCTVLMKMGHFWPKNAKNGQICPPGRWISQNGVWAECPFFRLKMGSYTLFRTCERNLA